MYRVFMRLVPLVATAGLLAGCSAMPEWTKPTTWYDGVTGEAETAKSEAAPPAQPTEAKAVTAVASDGALPPVDDPLDPTPAGPRIKPSEGTTEFPNLAAQPAPREALTTDAQRREIRDSLVADRDRAQYSADELRAGGAAPAAAPPPAAKKVAAPAEDEEAAEKPSGE